MTIGAGSFNPGASFGFPRSYINDFYVYRNGDTVVQAGNKFIVTDAFNPALTATFELHPHFLPWSSNAWTLDHIIIQSYYQNTVGGVENPLPYNLIFYSDPLKRRNGLYLGWSGMLFDPQHFAIPAQTPGYWLPKPL